MTDTATPPALAPAATPAAAGQPARGETDISTQVVEKLAVRLATEVPGVIDRPVTGLLGALPSRPSRSTSAEAVVGRSTARVALHLDVGYAVPVCHVVNDVRTHVQEGLERLTGLTTTRLDVTVHHIITSPRTKRRVA
jgi:uncharacterized alkaline shock family protein YloU